MINNHNTNNRIFINEKCNYFNISFIFLIPIILEYCVIINLYNGNISSYIHQDIEYSLMDIFVLFTFILYNYIKKRNNTKIDNIEFILTLISFISHIQWYLHNPFQNWPSWWFASKKNNDIRHRTEYYDTHVMVFFLYTILFIRRNPRIFTIRRNN